MSIISFQESRRFIAILAAVILPKFYNDIKVEQEVWKIFQKFATVSRKVLLKLKSKAGHIEVFLLIVHAARLRALYFFLSGSSMAICLSGQTQIREVRQIVCVWLMIIWWSVMIRLHYWPLLWVFVAVHCLRREENGSEGGGIWLGKLEGR